ncbi:MAG: amidohydrolase family protein [Desulfobulbus sp.]|jgi:5-methylthioadenosine/S-adenosylhomocysteine deaminase
MSAPNLLLTGQYLLTMDAARTLIADGALAISGETIVAVGPAAELRERFPGAEELATPRGLIMPGLVNVHTHASMALFRGLADDLPLMRWLHDHIFPVEARLTGELVYQGALLSLCEMIRSGTTSFCDMYLFAAEVGRAAAEAGVRAWVGEAMYDFPSPCYGPLENGFACVRDLFARFRNHPLVTVTLCPHAVYTCSPDLLTRIGAAAQDENALLVIHLAENSDEVRTCFERYGQRPAAHLDALGLLGTRTVAAHCVMLDEDEIRLLAKRGVGVAHCPESNLKLASGIAPAARMLEAGVKLGIGTDGSASNNDVDMFGEMRTAAFIHKAAQLDPTAMPADLVLEAATLSGARVLGAEQSIGSLEPGKKADCIVLDLDQPHLTPLYNPVSHLVYAARGGDVLHSVINGKVVMRDRCLLTLDQPAILARAREIASAFRTGCDGG